MEFLGVVAGVLALWLFLRFARRRRERRLRGLEVGAAVAHSSMADDVARYPVGRRKMRKRRVMR